MYFCRTKFEKPRVSTACWETACPRPSCFTQFLGWIGSWKWGTNANNDQVWGGQIQCRLPQTDYSPPELCNFTGAFTWALASFTSRTFFYSSGSFLLSPKEVFWFMRAINLSIPDTLEGIPMDLRLWWPGVPGTLKGLYGRAPKICLLKCWILAPVPSIKRSTLLLGCLSGVCESTGLFTLPETISYKPEQRPGMAL